MCKSQMEDSRQEDGLSAVDSTLLLSLVWEEAQENQTATEDVR